MNKKALILQHTTEERGGLFEEVLIELGWGLEILPLFAGADLPPSLNGFGLTLVMGGPMSANQEKEHPFLKEEIPFIRKALKMEEPVLGICLGAQLMAKALGARVYPGPHKEIGWYWLNQTPSARNDPLFSLLDPYFMVFQWHGETFDLPTGADCLAGNPAYPRQAFRWGEVAYGLQFHLEMTQPMLHHWLASWGEEIRKARPQPNTGEDILRDAAIYLERLQSQARRVILGYIRLLEKKKKFAH
jgi:GMP synthase (glutamine-hydrolysing)